MKTFFTSLLCVLAYSFTVAQITIDPNPVIVEDFDVSEFEAVAYSFVTNESQSNKVFTWQRNVIEMTEGWSSAVCDLNQCYLSFVSTQEFALGAGATGNLDVHLYPDGIEGAAIIEVIITDNSNPENAETGVYLFNETLSVPERLTNAIQIYPNPAESFIFLDGGENVSRLEIFDVQGRLVKEFQNFGAGNLEVSGIGAGNYIVRMYDVDGDQLSSNLLQLR